MRRPLIAIPFTAVLALAGCGTSTAEPSVAAPSSSAPPSAAASSTIKAVNSEAFLAGLRVVDPGLVANEDRALRRARDICLDVSQNEFTNKQLAERAAERYSGGTVTLTSEQGAKVVALAKANVC
ncbi:hypothetical protein [Micromonospora aurantiaca (nom. illeg.)]|uniref:hypothetical protein n=1 Tax=Micromonospora aurantiaca (nom. illeg.) TaxID=47850 RepID=UPI0033C1ED73